MTICGKQRHSSAGPNGAFLILILISHGLKFCLSHDEEFCRESQSTVKSVQNCPITKSIWEERALQKDCSSFSHNCSGALFYHCLINPWQNTTLEVCAPRTKIKSGHCAEYSPEGGRIQEYYKPSCSSCATDYLSTEAYQYEECYTTVYSLDNRSRLTTESYPKTISGTQMTSPTSQIWIYTLSLLLCSMISEKV